ncbi:hypothetical protein ABZ342_16550 [Amycolatopsis sp. NPDC005961]|uniref:hypothetical protein n=1 Tax=Amycolatopsis sp. NPDC005961 TaxID=3156720 RepID=UPI0033C33D48
MSGGENDPRRRRRPAGRPQLPPGPLRELKNFVYELYLLADLPTLDTIAGWIAADDDLAAAPDRTTAGRIISGPRLPASHLDVVAVVIVLARAAGVDAVRAAGQARELWHAASLAPSIGKPLAEITDPFALEVHRPITFDDADGLPGLPPYIRRPHDDRLAEVIARAMGGESAIAVLVAGSSAGKTRTCWEALEPLRTAGGWRLWHPFDPGRSEAALKGLDQVGPRTVVWLNETQEYCKGEPAEGVAAKIRSMLADPSRAPVLVLGTLWPEHHADLTQNPGAQIQQVLDGAVIEVPEAFGTAELEVLKKSTPDDDRLAWAAAHAADGQITQWLAGGPALLARFATVGPVEKAFIQVAMDAVRMGHRNALPHALLVQAVEAYLTDAQRSSLKKGWEKRALARIAEPCKGAPGPVTPIPQRVNGRDRRRPRTPKSGELLFRLADYLDQYSRKHRADWIPPIGFWTAAVASAGSQSLAALAISAWNRGLYRDSVALNKEAVRRGSTFAGASIIDRMNTVHPGDLRGAEWVVENVPLDSPYGVAMILERIRAIGTEDLCHAAAARVAAGVSLVAGVGFGALLRGLHEVGDPGLVDVFLARDPASAVALENASEIGRFLQALHAAGGDEQVAALLRRDPSSHVSVDLPLNGAGKLIVFFRAIGAEDQMRKLAERVATGLPLSHASDVAGVLEDLAAVGCADHVRVLLSRTPAAQVAVDQGVPVARLLLRLADLGAAEQVATLSERAAAGVRVDEPREVTALLEALRTVGENECLAVVLSRDPSSAVSLNSPMSLGSLISQFVELGAREQAAILARRAAGGAPLSDWGQVNHLLDILRRIRAHDELRVLLERDFLSVDDVTSWWGAGGLLKRLHDLGVRDRVVALATRIAEEAKLDDADNVAYNLDCLEAVGAVDQVGVLLRRGPEGLVSLGNPLVLAKLLEKLQQLGTRTQVELLAGRAASGAPLDNPFRISALADRFADLGLTGQLEVFLDRLPASSASVKGNLRHVRNLLRTLRRFGRADQAAELIDRLVNERGGEQAGSVQAKLVEMLFEAEAIDKMTDLLANEPGAHVDLTDPTAVKDLLSALQVVGAEDQLRLLLSREPAAHADVERPRAVVNLCTTLSSVGADGQAAKLAARAAAESPLRDASEVGLLLAHMRRVGAAGDEARLLAREPARHVEIGRYDNAAFLLKKLHGLESDDQVQVLADRIAAETWLGYPDTVTGVLEALRSVGADAQATLLEERSRAAYFSDEDWTPPVLMATEAAVVGVTSADRLPAAGKFDRFLETGDNAVRFRFGREPDGAPAEPWTWDDLA